MIFPALVLALLLFIWSLLNGDILETWLFSRGPVGIHSLGLERRGEKKKWEKRGRRGNEGWKENKKKTEIKSGEKVGVTGVKLTARISDLIKTKTTFVLFVCGEKLQFTSITDIVNFHNSAIKLVSHFYDIRVDVQEKAKQNPPKTDRKRKKNTHTNFKPRVYLERASHLFKMTTAV